MADNPDLRVLVGNEGDALPSGASASLIRKNLEKALGSQGQPVKIRIQVDPQSINAVRDEIAKAFANININPSVNGGSATSGKAGQTVSFQDFTGATVSTRAMSQATAELTKQKLANAAAIQQETLASMQAINASKQQAAATKAAVEASKLEAQEAKTKTALLREEAQQKKLNAQINAQSGTEKTAKSISDANLMLQRFNEYLRTLNPKAFSAMSGDIDTIRKQLGTGLPDDIKKARAGINNFKASMKQMGYEGGNMLTYLEGKLKTFGVYLLSSTITMGAVNSVKQIVTNVKDLDAAMTDLRIVTGGTKSETQELLKTYNQMAQTLGTTTKNVASGAVDWLRQGYNAADSAELLKQSMTLSIVGSMDASESTDALTAALKGYSLEVSDASKVVDKFFKVDMSAATSSSNLALALAKTAANAKIAGMSLDDVIGQLAVVNETMKESGEETGTFYNTMLSRIGNIKAGRLSDPETSEDLSDVEATLSGLGIKLRDSEGEFRNFGSVLDEVGSRWDSFSSVQQRAIATAFAGPRQQTRFLSLMEGWSQAGKYAEEAANSTGIAAQKMELYQQSVEAKSQRMAAAFENLSSSLLDSDLVGAFYDIGTGVFNLAAGLPDVVQDIAALTAGMVALHATFNAIKATQFGQGFLQTFKDLGWPETTGDNIVPIHCEEAA